MRAQWHALHADLVRTSTRLSVQTHYQTMRGRQEALSALRDPVDLFERLHAPAEGDGEARNAILRALVLEAQQGEHPQTAVVLLVLALWPGLDAVYRRLLRHFPSEPELLVSEISERVTRGIERMSLDRVTWVAAALVRNTERDIRRSLAVRWREEGLREDLPEEGIAAVAPEPSVFQFTAAAGADQAATEIEMHLRSLIGPEAELVTAIAIHGEPQNEAATRLGISHAAARKRYQRALTKLRGHFDADEGDRPLSHGAGRSGLSAARAPKRSAPRRAGAVP